MSSRLIERLDRLIADADEPFTREKLKAERAGVLARMCRIADARFALAGVRSQSQRLRQPVLAFWVCLVEGQVEHFDSMSRKARDKFVRAHTLALSIGDPALQATAAAWIAACDFNGSDYVSMATHLREALTLARPTDHLTLARAGLVLVSAYQAAGDIASAQRWFGTTRSHALAEGDVALMSMLLHNAAAGRSSEIWLNHQFGRADEAAARQALLEVESGGNFNVGIGNETLTTLVPIVRAHLLAACGRVEEAIAMFDNHLKQAVSEGMTYCEPRIRADRAWCLWKVGRTAEALREARWADGTAANQQDPDDRASAHARLAQVFEGLGRAADSERHRALAEKALTEHRAKQQQIRALLARALDGVA